MMPIASPNLVLAALKNTDSPWSASLHQTPNPTLFLKLPQFWNLWKYRFSFVCLGSTLDFSTKRKLAKCNLLFDTVRDLLRYSSLIYFVTLSFKVTKSPLILSKLVDFDNWLLSCSFWKCLMILDHYTPKSSTCNLNEI